MYLEKGKSIISFQYKNKPFKPDSCYFITSALISTTLDILYCLFVKTKNISPQKLYHIDLIEVDYSTIVFVLFYDLWLILFISSVSNTE